MRSRSIRKALDGRVPLIGFSGSPWTLACYMVEGAGSDDYRHVKALMYSRPDLLHHILAVNAAAVAAYLNAQIDAGAQAVMVFDSWGGVLAHDCFAAVQPRLHRAACVSQLTRERDGRVVPRIVFTKGGGPWLEAIAALRRRRGRARLDRAAARRRARASTTAWRCRATSTRRCCSRRPSVVRAAGARACWMISARRGAPTDGSAAMCSTSATASASTRRPSTCMRWSTQCIAHSRRSLERCARK